MRRAERCAACFRHASLAENHRIRHGQTEDVVFLSARSSLLASVALLVLVPGAQAFDRTGPAGEGYAITVPEPTATYPLPLADNYRNQTGKNEKGEAVRAYDDRDNPIIEILSGFNRIWILGDEKWADGGANGDGPADFSHVKIVDPAVWQENMRYVLSVTGKTAPAPPLSKLI